jgi:hypothetical protein
MKTGRNEPCPCGSGKKFKKCHMGKEDELALGQFDEISVEEMGEKISSLPLVDYGRSKEIFDTLDLGALTGSAVGVKCVDLKEYQGLNLFGGGHAGASKGRTGGLFINLYKTVKVDPDHIYLAISKDIDDSSLIHEIAHVLDYLKGSKLVPGTLEPLSMELGIPVEHLEHPEEYGHWLIYLKERFDIVLDADDAIIAYLYNKGMLIKGKEIGSKNGFLLKSKSDRILTFMSEHCEEVDEMIRDLPGYIGARKADN